jgi:hypothetical protein
VNNALTRAVIVVFDERTTDTEAALVRNGLRMFRGVKQIIPVRGVPSDVEARTLLARDSVGIENAELRQQRDELALRVQQAQEAVTGPVPGLDTREVAIPVAFDRDVDLQRRA